jgi:hypothetical protein
MYFSLFSKGLLQFLFFPNFSRFLLIYNIKCFLIACEYHQKLFSIFPSFLSQLSCSKNQVCSCPTCSEFVQFFCQFSLGFLLSFFFCCYPLVTFEYLTQQHDSSIISTSFSLSLLVDLYDNSFIPFSWYSVFCPNSP